MNIVIFFLFSFCFYKNANIDGFSKSNLLLQATQLFMLKPSHHSLCLQGEGKYCIQPEAPHKASDAGNKESSSCGPGGGGGGIRLYGKGYLPTERTGKEHYVCVRGCT